MRLLYLDCAAGAAGDMLAGALVDAGLPLDELRAALGSLAFDACDITLERVSRAGIGAAKFRVLEPADGRSNHHHHHLESVLRRIARSALSAEGRSRAQALFRRLAEVEAEIHQVPLDRVHLHEVGALDSIVDIVSVVFGFEWFGPARVVASPVNMGQGRVACAHGDYPVPAPATARLLEGAPVYAAGPQAELTTPTGALLVTAFASTFGPVPPMRLARIGYGAGERDFPRFPNVVRILVGEEERAPIGEPVLLLECEIDDMNPQIFGLLMDRLHAAGALDVFYAPVQMKKNRPGTLLTIVAPPDARERLASLVFRESTTIGLRYQEVWRERLEREIVTVETPVGPIRFKVARRDGAVVNLAPEFDDCAARASERGLAVKDVQALAMKAYLDRKA
jgi:uncharacterized protein (TIGR00299 family) protein